MVLRKTTHVRPIRHSGPKARKIEAKEIAKALGAEIIHREPRANGSPLAMAALRQEIVSRLASTGGRPGLQGTKVRPKIPLTSEDWNGLEKIAEAFTTKGVNATPAHVASAIIHKHLAQIKEGKEDATKINLEDSAASDGQAIADQALQRDQEGLARRFPVLAESGRLAELPNWLAAAAKPPRVFPIRIAA